MVFIFLLIFWGVCSRVEVRLVECNEFSKVGECFRIVVMWGWGIKTFIFRGSVV